ncbi:MAG TPA: arylsulfotransferase family protein, partial [Puia sp.]|nr:arylsulfotransferase family protein [Puia sp.]
MKNIAAFLLLFFLLAQKISLAQFAFISPIPGSKYHRTNCTIILRNGSTINESSLHNKKLFSITGATSGEHQVSVILSYDQKTIILKPAILFAEGETVTVNVRDGIRKSDGGIIAGCNFSFQTRQHLSADQQSNIRLFQRQLYEADFGNIRTQPATTREPTDFPKFTLDVNTNPSPGDVFYYNSNFYGNPGSYICIMTSAGDSIYAQKTTSKGSTFDINHNGYLTVFNYDSAYFEMWDSSYNIIDTYKAGNGYGTDAHDFQIFPDGHSFLLASDPEIVDMTVYNPLYKPDATVFGAVLQELDAAKNVIFEWRSWDHVEITEVEHQDLSGQYIDYVHPNAIELDTDGNILMSCRVLSQVMKINRTTGEVMWRLGGEKNEYSFPNDTG